jgi:ABC-type transport system involved in multi-copper enzyme maturation permease subunit
MIPMIGRSFGRIAPALAATAAIFAVFQVGLVAVAASFWSSGEFERLSSMVPQVLRAALAPALTSFGNMTTLGYFDPLIVIFVAQWAIYVGTEPAGEVEAGLVDLVLARPVPRSTFVTRSLIVTMGSTLVVTLSMGAATFLALFLLAPSGVPWPDPGVILLLIAHLTLVAWCCGTAAVAASGWARRRAAVLAVVTITVGTMYLVDFLSLWWRPMERLAVLTPFQYFHGGPILTGTADPVRNLTVLAVVAGVAIGVAYWRFERRDL